jgi:hypothetical protein
MTSGLQIQLPVKGYIYNYRQLYYYEGTEVREAASYKSWQ